MLNNSTPVSRRRAIGGAAFAAGTVALAACSAGNPSDDPSAGLSGAPTEPAAGGVHFPDFIPLSVATPDIDRAHELGRVGYTSFPSDPPRAIPDKPLSGETIVAAVALQSASPTPMSNNAWWQAVNDLLGGTLELDFAPAADYPAKLSSRIAGGDLPDLVQIPGGLANRAQALEAQFIDLSEHLGGDKIAEYDQLANIPQAAWKGTVFGGGVRGIPYLLGFVSSRIITREDILASHGLSSDEVASADDFFELCQGVTDAAASRWALGQANWFPSYIAEMFNVPNVWRVDGGTWTRDIESEEFIEALTFMKKLWDAELIHPDAFGTLNAIDSFNGGRIVIMSSGGAGMVSTYNQYKTAAPELVMGMPVAPKADGSGQSSKHMGSGIYTLTSIPNSVDPDKIPALLHVLNTMGAGWGTQEYLAVNRGAEGTDWEWRDGEPTPLPTASGEKIPVNYLPGCMAGGYYSAGHPEIVETAMAYEKKLFEVEPTLFPTAGLFSETDAATAAELGAFITDNFGAVVQGRSEISAWPDVVAEWKERGGDKIRDEYAAAAEAQEG